MAFNIDIEVGPAEDKKYRVFCASLTDNWSIDIIPDDIEKLTTNLKKEKAKDLPASPDPKDLNATEAYLSQLGAMSSVLRLGAFHEFLQVPQSVREGLAYVADKPLGKIVRTGYMLKHSRYVRRPGIKRFFSLVADDRGGTMLCYENEKNKQFIASVKISPATELANLPDNQIQNAFVLKSGKRQWILECSQSSEYYVWMAQIRDMLKQAAANKGAKQESTPPPSTNANDNTNNKFFSSTSNTTSTSSSTVTPSTTKNPAPTSANDAKAQADENKRLKQEVEFYRQKEGTYKDQIQKLEVIIGDLKKGKEQQRLEVEKDLKKEMEIAKKNWDNQHETLRKELEELHRKLEIKIATQSSAFKLGLFDDYKDSDGKTGDEESLQNDDAEKNALNQMSEEERKQIKVIHRHLHRHNHKHIYHHRHTHVHDESSGEIYINTHTVGHTITHTSTEIKIKKSLF